MARHATLFAEAFLCPNRDGLLRSDCELSPVLKSVIHPLVNVPNHDMHPLHTQVVKDVVGQVDSIGLRVGVIEDPLVP